MAALVGALPANSKAAMLFISGVHTVHTYDLDTATSTTVYAHGFSYPAGIGYDAEQNDVYFIVNGSGSYYKDLVRDTQPLSYGPVETVCDWNDNTISWNNLDVGPGTQVALAYSHRFGQSQYWSRPTRVVLHDVVTNAQTILYEAEKYAIVGWQGYYNPQPIWATIHGIRDVVFDPTGQYVYFTDGPEGTINRVPVDGSTGREIIVSGLNGPYCLDILGDAIYWTESGTGAIRKSGLMGENVTDLLFPSEAPGSIAVGGGEVFWTQGSQEWATVWRANLDGSNPRLVDGAPSGEDIAFGTPFAPQPAVIPEPSTFAIWSLLGFVGIGACYWRRRRKG